jgi:hypothetical protein
MLLELSNTCIASLDVPQDWFTTILVGGKTRDITRELEVLTVLIDMRLRAWAEANDIFT